MNNVNVTDTAKKKNFDTDKILTNAVQVLSAVCESLFTPTKRVNCRQFSSFFTTYKKKTR